MTFILTGTTYGSVIQVSDRLVTDRDTRAQFDALANKNVVFLARDGLLTIAYTGRAYVEDEPTDRWIARKLALDETLQDDGLGAVETGFFIPDRWMDVGTAMKHLAEEFTRAWTSSRYGIGEMQVIASGFQWPAAGWQWTLGRSRPVIWEILCRASKPTFAAFPMTRYFGWERRLVTVAALPHAAIADSTFRSLTEDLAAATTPEAVIDRMVSAVREVASNHDVVGRDCMCIHLPSPSLSRTVTSLYVPSDERDEGSPVSAFTPWIVAPDTKVAPTILNGFALEVPSGPFTFKFEGPQNLQIRPDRSIVVFQSQPRPKAPDRRPPSSTAAKPRRLSPRTAGS